VLRGTQFQFQAFSVYYCFFLHISIFPVRKWCATKKILTNFLPVLKWYTFASLIFHQPTY
jgi:hypothetical protein